MDRYSQGGLRSDDLDQVAVEQQIPQAPKPKPSIVLLVEDHRIAAKVAKAILSDLNCQVDIAMDGKMALEAVEKRHYDLIFMDIGLPGMNGYEITRRIRSQELSKGTHIPIIALTAHADSQNQQLCLDAAMNAIVTKPLRREKAEDVLNEFIPHRKKWVEHNQEEAAIDNDLFNLGEKIVDFEYTTAFLGENKNLMNETLTTFIDSLPWEIKKLEEAYEQGNWEAIDAIVHKLKGGASYCGTLRLESACTKLDNYIKSGGQTLAPQLYQQLLSEVEALRKFMGDGTRNF